MLDFQTAIGSLAAILTTVALFPQLIKVLRDKDTRAISLGMYITYTTGVGLWFIYGWMLGSLPMIVANIVTFIVAFIILVMKLRLG